MRNIGEKFKKTASRWLDIPQDVAVNVPRITMVGPYRLHVENHRGVERFSDTELQLKTTKGSLLIQGKRLVIQAIYTEELWVEGDISEVKFL